MQSVGVFVSLSAWTSRVNYGVVYVHILYSNLRDRPGVHIAPIRPSGSVWCQEFGGYRAAFLLLSPDSSLVGKTLIGDIRFICFLRGLFLQQMYQFLGGS